METKRYKVRTFRSLKDAETQLIRSCGGYDAATTKCRVSRTMLTRYADRNANPNVHMPIDVVEALEAAAGQPIVTAYLAEKLACHLVPNPKAETTPSDIHVNIAKTAEHASNLFREWANALADDGYVDADEAQDLLVHADVLVRTLLIMKSDLLTRMKDPHAKRVSDEKSRRKEAEKDSQRGTGKDESAFHRPEKPPPRR